MTSPATPSAITTGTSAEPVIDRTHIDWITVTHADVHALRPFLRGPVQERKRGIHVFARSAEDGYGAILAWQGCAPRPAMLVLSGKALGAWRADFTERALVEKLAQVKAHCTRLDLSRDTSGPWTPYRLREFIEADRYVSLWHKFDYRCAKGDTALTVYCGSRSSAVMLRCYDKKAEMESKGDACPLPRLSRWEIEIKGDRAPKAFQQIARLREDTDPLSGEVDWPLRSVHGRWLGIQVRLTEAPVDRENNNHARAVTVPEWVNFVASAHDGDLGLPVDDRSVEALALETGSWARATLAPTLALIDELGGERALRQLVEDGRGRMNSRQQVLSARADRARAGLLAGLGITPLPDAV